VATSQYPLSWRYITPFPEAVTKTIGIVLVADLAARLTAPSKASQLAAEQIGKLLDPLLPDGGETCAAAPADQRPARISGLAQGGKLKVGWGN
jgi:hypothetical protein